ncbi:hypothetical protein NHQ30_000392 [Ciborinia camelliae]|nr:hypothetical protein NHQ30_000392 [Ciborinia camelliae]
MPDVLPWRPSTRRYPVEYQSQAGTMLQFLLKNAKPPFRRADRKVEFQSCLDNIRKELKLIHNECVLDYLSELLTWNKYSSSDVVPNMTFVGELPPEQQECLDYMYHIDLSSWLLMTKVKGKVKRVRSAVRLLQKAAQRADKAKREAKKGTLIVEAKNPPRVFAKQLAEMTNWDFEMSATQDQTAKSLAESSNIDPTLETKDLPLVESIDAPLSPEVKHLGGLTISNTPPSRSSTTCWVSCWCCWCCHECCCKRERLPNAQGEAADPFAETSNMETTPEEEAALALLE